MKPGNKVTYRPFKGCDDDCLEKGIVKSLSEDRNYVFVVYYCGEDWDNYMDYTAARTNINQLIEGWPDENL